jgi:hypothetical protein
VYPQRGSQPEHHKLYETGGSVDITKSISFVEQNGSEIEKARLRHILYGATAKSEILQPFINLQNGDGGFPLNRVKGQLSTINDSLNALWWMEDLGILGSTTSEKTIQYLFDTQLEDGGLDEDPIISSEDLPEWIIPGELLTRHYLSAYSSYWLAIMNYRANPAYLLSLDFLDTHLDEGTLFQGYLHTTWMASSVFLMAGEAYNEAAMIGMQTLLCQPKSRWKDSQLSWALDCLGKAGLAKEHPFIQMGIKELMLRQSADGSWSSEGGPAFTINGTIAALKAFKQYPPL